MGETHYNNAMTEISLALAMGFFSIMVLAMVSMGVPVSADNAGGAKAKTALHAALAPANNTASKAARLTAAKDDTLLIYLKGKFYDGNLKTVEPAGLTSPGRVILALEPNLTMTEALKARSRLKAQNLTITTLDRRWLEATKHIKQHHNALQKNHTQGDAP